MKKIFFITVIMLLAQMVFAEEWNTQEVSFCEAFGKSDLSGMEMALKNKNNKTDMEVLLYTVLMNYDFYNGTSSINTDKSIALPVFQLLARYGTDVEKGASYHYARDKQDPKYIGTVSSGATLYTLLKMIVKNTCFSPQITSQIVKSFFEAGTNPNCREEIDSSKFLAVPLKDDKIAITRVFIEYGLDVNFRNGYLLAEAIDNNQIAIIKLLVESGAMVNTKPDRWSNQITPAEVAYKAGQIDIYNYLKQNGAVWTAPSQVASTPSPSSQPRQTYNESYDYSPPPSSSRSSSSSSSGSTWADVGKAITEAFTPPLESGTYGISGTQLKISIAGIGKSGMLFYTNRQGKQVRGTYNIDGDRMTIQADGFTYVYTITSKTSFSGNGETWYRTGN
jgi:ankyrin repeat protein